MRKGQHNGEAYAPHPRYGTGPRYSRLGDDPAHCAWARRKGVSFIPGTAVRGNPARQQSGGWNLADVEFYVDEVRRCSGCRRQYLFYAAEQCFWYEVLRLPLYVDPVRCAGCRRDDRSARALLKQYRDVQAVPLKERSAWQHIQLAAIAVALHDAGMFTRKILPKARHALNQVPDDHRNRDWKAADRALRSAVDAVNSPASPRAQQGN